MPTKSDITGKPKKEESKVREYSEKVLYATLKSNWGISGANIGGQLNVSLDEIIEPHSGRDKKAQDDKWYFSNTAFKRSNGNRHKCGGCLQFPQQVP